MAKKPASKPPAKSAPAPKSTVEIFDVEQGTDAWLRLRMGLPTASNFSAIMAQSAEQKGCATLLRQLAGERITGLPTEDYKSGHMNRGNEMEARIRAAYIETTFDETRQVGFVRNGICGCSPDLLVGDDGGAEFKSMAPEKMIALIEKGSPPPTTYRAQVQGCLLVTERKWWDLCIGYDGMPLLKWRFVRDEAYIAEMRDALLVFDLDLRNLVKKIKGSGIA